MVSALKRRIDQIEDAERARQEQAANDNPQGAINQEGEQVGNLGEAYQDTLKLVRENRDRAERAMSSCIQTAH
jgi:hypothetical protein